MIFDRGVISRESKEQVSTSPKLPFAIVPEEWKKWKTGEDINLT